MDEGTGSSIQDSTGTLAAGSLGIPAATNAPKWSTVGLELTSISEYVELPVFPTTASGNPFTTHSFTISFWFKFNIAFGTAKIFRYTTAALDYDNFGLYVDSTGALTIGMANQASTQTSPLLLSSSVWTLITASYNTGSSGSSTYNPMSLYQDRTFTIVTQSSPPSLNSGPYRVIIGGSNSFLGTIAHLRILSPASNYIHDLTTCSSSSSTTPAYFQCALNLGMSDPKTCVSYPCGDSNCDRCSGGGTYDSCLSCSSTFEYSNGLSLCNVSQPVTTPSVNPVIEPAQTTTSTLSKVYSALTKGSSSGFSAAIAGKIFSNIKYLDIGYSLELQEALKSWQSSFISMGLDLDPPQGLQEIIPELGVPPTFKKYNVSSDFLINFYESTIFLLVMVGLFAVFRVVEYCTNASKHKKFPYSTLKSARFMTQNLLYSQFYGIFADIVMFSILDYRTQDLENGFASFGLVLSISLLIITAIVLGLQFYLLIRYQRLKNNQNALEKLTQESQGSLVTFEDFKDTSLLRQAFLFLLVLRDVLFSLILTTLFEHPLAQTILILLLNLAMVAFLIFSQPFKKRFGLFQQIFYETVTLAVNISVIILAAKDQQRSTAYDLRQSTGKFIIITNLIFNFTVIAFLCYGLFMTFKEAYQDHQAKKAKKSSSITIDSQLADSSYIHTRGLMNSNQKVKIKGRANGMETSGNELLFGNLETPIDLSLIEIPKTRNRNNAMKNRDRSHFIREQQQQHNRKYNQNIIGVNNNIPQRQVDIHARNFKNNDIKNFGVENHRTDNKAQDQRRGEIQIKDYSLASLTQAAGGRRIQKRKNKERPQFIRGKHDLN